MPETGLDKASSALDTKLLAHLIYELNIARRHLVAYPKGHPLVVTTLRKVLRLSGELFEISDEITLGVAKDTLMVGAEFLDRGNPVFRDFAKCLFSHSVAALTLRKGITLDEVIRFNEIISQKHEAGTADHDIAQRCEAAAIEHITVKCFNYDLLRVAEHQESGIAADGLTALRSSALWERFVTGILEGALDPQAEVSPPADDFDPELLAAVLNGRFREKPEELQESYAKAITEYMRRLDREEVALGAETMGKLNRFVKSLNPELRRRFLSTSCIALGARPDMAMAMLTKYPDEVILDALQESVRDESYLPPVIMSVFQRLSKAAEGVPHGANGDQPQDLLVEQFAEKLQAIFREDELDKYVPADYQAHLQCILTAESLTASELTEIEDLKRTLASHCVEVQVASVILDIVESSDTDPSESLAKALEEHCRYFSQTGDFDTLLTVYEKMSAPREREPRADTAVQQRILAYFAEPEFIEDVLNGPAIWGKAKIPSIGALIQKIGTVFIEPLLHRLAEEENMFLRRFFIDRLIELGRPVRDAALQRLDDTRWYFVRNLLVILRSLNDGSILPHVRAIIEHPHPRVRQEMIKTLLHYRDPVADALLLQELGDQDPERRLSAVRLAGKSENADVRRLLVSILEKKSLTGIECEMRIAAVQSLAEIGDSSALQSLEAILRSKSILHPHMLHMLKAEIVTSLGKYPSESAARLLRDVAAGGKGKLSSLAAACLRDLWSKKR